MAGPSKNSRASRSSTGNAKASVVSSNFLIPVGAGAGAYVLLPEQGINPRYPVTSPEFAAAIGTLVEAGYGTRIANELDALHVAYPTHGWDDTKARLVDGGVLPA